MADGLVHGHARFRSMNGNTTTELAVGGMNRCRDGDNAVEELAAVQTVALFPDGPELLIQFFCCCDALFRVSLELDLADDGLAFSAFQRAEVELARSGAVKRNHCAGAELDLDGPAGFNAIGVGHAGLFGNNKVAGFTHSIDQGGQDGATLHANGGAGDDVAGKGEHARSQIIAVAVHMPDDQVLFDQHLAESVNRRLRDVCFLADGDCVLRSVCLGQIFQNVEDTQKAVAFVPGHEVVLFACLFLFGIVSQWDENHSPYEWLPFLMCMWSIQNVAMDVNNDNYNITIAKKSAFCHDAPESKEDL